MPDTVDVRVFKEGLTVRAKDWATTVVWPLRLETEGGPGLPEFATNLSPLPDRSRDGWYFQPRGEYVNINGRLDAALTQIAEDEAVHGLTHDQAVFLGTVSGPSPWLVYPFEVIPDNPPRVVSTRTRYDEVEEHFRVGWHPLPTIDVKTRYPRVWN